MSTYSEQADGYSFVPTVLKGEGSRGDHEQLWTAPYPLDTAAVIEHCQANGFDGAHVFTGPDGAIIGEGNREENYHGWIDARPAVIA